jgi:hypothetical protein
MGSETENSDPELSVIVAIIEGGREATERCLEALAKSAEGVNIECLVPFDMRLDGVAELQEKFGWATFIDAREDVDLRHSGSSSREHHDILRAIGLRSATAPIVALLEDHGTPSPTWCQALMKAHRESEAAVIGGAVENGKDRLLNWAVYYCDFGRYQNPVPSGPVEYASDSNVSYKRGPLMAIKQQWYTAYHETSVHWELRRRGEQIALDPKMIVFQTRNRLKSFAALYERLVWGRSFAGTRSSEIIRSKRFIFALFSFLLPFVLTARIAARGFEKRRHLSRLLAALPLIFLLETVWAWGEFIGYVTGKAASQGRLPAQLGQGSL